MRVEVIKCEFLALGHWVEFFKSIFNKVTQGTWDEKEPYKSCVWMNFYVRSSCYCVVRIMRSSPLVISRNLKSLWLIEITFPFTKRSTNFNLVAYSVFPPVEMAFQFFLPLLLVSCFWESLVWDLWTCLKENVSNK